MSQSRLTLEQLEYQNVILIMIKYIDTYSHLHTVPEDEFTLTIKASLLGYGMNHAAKGTGLFTDIYQREAAQREVELGFGFRFERHIELYDTLRETAGDKTFLAISTTTIAKYLVNRLFPNSVYYGQVIFIAVATAEVSAAKKILQPFGIYPAMDTQLLLLAAKKSFDDTMRQLIEKAYPPLKELDWHQFIETIKTHHYPVIARTAAETKADIEALLSHALTLTYADNQHFYLTCLQKLLLALTITPGEEAKTTLTPFATDQLLRALHRLYYLVVQLLDFADAYPRFLSLVDYCFDELKLLTAILQPYTPQQMLAISQKFIEAQYQLTTTPYDVNTMLVGSGMHGITNLLYSAIKQINLQPQYQSGQKTGKILLVKNIYYEITQLVATFFQLPLDTSHADGLVEFSKQPAKASQYGDELVDIVVGDFKKNVHATASHHEATELIDIINQQFELRKQIHVDQPLIVVIDTTMNTFDDSQMTFLLACYEDKMATGQLVVLTGCSLNKYFHLGIDKTPAGLTCGFYLSERFPAIKKCFTTENGLDDFPVRSPTLQMISHTIECIASHILDYSTIIMGNARFVYAKLVPTALFNTPQTLEVLSPTTQDIFGDYWGFVVIRLNNHNSIVFDVLVGCLTRLLALLGIQKRDGYGFNETTHITIPLQQPPQVLFRLSIGTESYKTLQHKLTPLLNFMSEANEILASLLPRDRLQPYLERLFAATHGLRDDVADSSAISAIQFVISHYVAIAKQLDGLDQGSCLAVKQEIKYLIDLLPSHVDAPADAHELMTAPKRERVVDENKNVQGASSKATLFATAKDPSPGCPDPAVKNESNNSPNLKN